MYSIFHNFHILTLSTYPYLIFLSSFFLSSILVFFFKFRIFNFLGFILFFFVIFVWFKDVCIEGLVGYHNFYVQDGLKLGMVFFIFREFMFFFGIFWVFFDSSLVPFCDLGESWTPFGVSSINPFGVPLLNSCILLRSGATVTWCHSRLLSNQDSFFRLLLTIFLSFFFIFIQFLEYSESSFNFRDSVYGRIFFFSTGFHGLHVLLGGSFLFYNLLRLTFNHFRFSHHIGLEFSILYWHFVDVVWLFLFIFVYWWSY